MNITLEQLLASRDARRVRQEELRAQFPGRTLVCLTVMLPGAEKRNDLSLRIAAAGVAAFRSAFTPVFEELRDLETGYEAYFLVDAAAEAVKRRCCAIEEAHPIGRLFDMDVIGADGAPLSRTVVGAAPRKCLLCGRPARWCMRERSHSSAELLACITRMTEAGLAKKSDNL